MLNIVTRRFTARSFWTDILSGMGTIMNLSGSYYTYNTKPSDKAMDLDREEILSDIEQVVGDMIDIQNKRNQSWEAKAMK